ncbi:MAG: hypothetical protein ACRBDI_03095 [Alphaproteobacteria bacterium]
MRFLTSTCLLILLLFVPCMGSISHAEEPQTTDNNLNNTEPSAGRTTSTDKLQTTLREKAQNQEENAIVWERHESITGSYETKFPQKYKYNVFPFQYNDSNVAYSAEIFADLEQGENEAEGKTAFIRSVSTLGNELSANRAEKALNSAVERYVFLAKNLKATIIENEEIEHNGFLGRQLYITYVDKDSSVDGKTALRITILMTNYTLIEQVVTGPAIGMYSYKADDFFKSIKLQDGIAKSTTPIGTGWIDIPSKNNTFTIKVPPKNKDYTPFDPVVQSSKTRDRVYYKIKDPITGSVLHYIATSYKLKSKPNKNTINSILTKYHLSKFIDSGLTKLSMKSNENNGVMTMETSVIISPIMSLPYISKLFYEVQIKDNVVLVKEFFSGAYHNDSGIDRTFFKLTEFHPEKYSHIPSQKKKPTDNKDDEKK